MPGSAGAPPPPPMPSTTAAPTNITKGRGALLGDIEKGRKLKKAVTNDRSAPLVGKEVNASSGPPAGGAPPVPRLNAPDANRVRANSDAPPASVASAVPQLGGILAGGIPKLRKTAGGVATGAAGDSAYQSDPESQRSSSAPRLPTSAAPRPPGAPPAPPPVPGSTAPPPPPAGVSFLKSNLRPTPASATSAPDTTPPRCDASCTSYIYSNPSFSTASSAFGPPATTLIAISSIFTASFNNSDALF
ncbi:hypothetical protein FH972_025654 [Carpinus fangiana]|uniref:WH2 domain-containing protein n=1 Tax=Carpinus fangiana TaxID=176857 RepID=A0A5N6L290_9ROSI|nr:hypothetical protein FH972_025654 [Carpinus fangiana]